jgi:hypothetical protein
MMQTLESRREQRIHVDLDVEYSLEGSMERHAGRATDISVGGIRIETTTAVPFHAVAVVRLRLPGSARPLALAGIVRWVRGGMMGLQWGLLSARETHLITQLAIASRQTLSEADVAWVG